MSDDKYKERMATKKAHIDARIAKATEERGVLIVLTGNGKGKSSDVALPGYPPPFHVPQQLI